MECTYNVTTTAVTPSMELRKSSIIDQDLDRLNIDIAALQETRRLGSGVIIEKNHSFFWQGKPEG